MKSRKKPSEHDAVEIKSWLKKIIDSCDTTFHFEGAQILIGKFEKICKRESDLVEVQGYFKVKNYKIHSIIR